MQRNRSWESPSMFNQSNEFSNLRLPQILQNYEVIKHLNYHMVMTNSSPWKIHITMEVFMGKSSIPMGHLYQPAMLVITRGYKLCCTESSPKVLHLFVVIKYLNWRVPHGIVPLNIWDHPWSTHMLRTNRTMENDHCLWKNSLFSPFLKLDGRGWGILFL